MPRINQLPHRDVERRDTLLLRSAFHYDPMAPRATTPVLLGTFIVVRRPLLGTIYTEYLIMDGPDILRTLISHPDEQDCATAVSAYRRSIAARIVGDTIKKAKKPRALRIKEVA